jgi:hypothetical protein
MTQQLLEGLDLVDGERIVREVRYGEMRGHAFDIDIRYAREEQQVA